MFARLNHIAIASDQYAINAKFYEALFGLRTAKNPRPARAVVVSDGHVGMNIIPRREGRTSGLDHFGLEVEDIEEARARAKEAVRRKGLIKCKSFTSSKYCRSKKKKKKGKKKKG